MSFAYVVAIAVKNSSFVLPDMKVVSPDNPLVIDCTFLEDNIEIREALAMGVKKGIIKVLFGPNELSYNDVIHIDEIRESGGGSNHTIAAGHVDVVDSTEVPISFVNANNNQFGVSVMVADNINTWVEKTSSNSFKIHLSANYTGRIDYLIYRAD